MQLLSKRSGPAPESIGARCPGCHREAAVSYEQKLLMAAGRRPYVFCPVCRRFAAAEPAIPSDGADWRRAGNAENQAPMASMRR